MPLSLRESVEKELDWLLEKCYIRKSNRQWASPMMTVKKPDGSARICVDFNHIHSVTTPPPLLYAKGRGSAGSSGQILGNIKDGLV